MKSFKYSALMISSILLAIVISGCRSINSGFKNITLAPASALPDFVRGSHKDVQNAYRFAIANPDILQFIPCYCGCGVMGHKNNLDCYIDEVKPDGSIIFDRHAFG